MFEILDDIDSYYLLEDIIGQCKMALKKKKYRYKRMAKLSSASDSQIPRYAPGTGDLSSSGSY